MTIKQFLALFTVRAVQFWLSLNPSDIDSSSEKLGTLGIKPVREVWRLPLCNVTPLFCYLQNGDRAAEEGLLELVAAEAAGRTGRKNDAGKEDEQVLEDGEQVDGTGATSARDQRGRGGHCSDVPGSSDPPRRGRQPPAGHVLGIGRRRIRSDVDPSESGVADVDDAAAAAVVVVVVRAAAAVSEGAGGA